MTKLQLCASNKSMWCALASRSRISSLARAFRLHGGGSRSRTQLPGYKPQQMRGGDDPMRSDLDKVSSETERERKMMAYPLAALPVNVTAPTMFRAVQVLLLPPTLTGSKAKPTAITYK